MLVPSLTRKANACTTHKRPQDGYPNDQNEKPSPKAEMNFAFSCAGLRGEYNESNDDNNHE